MILRKSRRILLFLIDIISGTYCIIFSVPCLLPYVICHPTPYVLCWMPYNYMLSLISHTIKQIFYFTSWDTGSNWPKSCPMVIAFGLITLVQTWKGKAWCYIDVQNPMRIIHKRKISARLFLSLFITLFIFSSPYPLSVIRVSVWAKTFNTLVLPAKGSPTNIKLSTIITKVDLCSIIHSRKNPEFFFSTFEQ